MNRCAIFTSIGFRHLDLPRGQDGLVDLLNFTVGELTREARSLQSMPHIKV